MTPYQAAVQRLLNFVGIVERHDPAYVGIGFSNVQQAKEDLAYLKDLLPTDGTWLRAMVDDNAGREAVEEYERIMNDIYGPRI